MSTLQPEDREALRREIQTAIAAGRDVDPELDAHLADSVLDRYSSEKSAREKALQQQPPPSPPPSQPHPFQWAFGSVLSLASIIAILVFARDLWWLIFIVPPMVGGAFGRSWGHSEYYSQRRELRHQYRITKKQMKLQYMQNHLKQLQKDEE